MNSENYLTHQKATQLIFQTPWDFLDISQQKYVSELLHIYLNLAKKDNYALGVALKSIHHSWPLNKIFKDFNIQEFGKLVLYFESISEYQCVWVLINSQIEVHPEILNNQFWLKKRDRYQMLADQKIKRAASS